MNGRTQGRGRLLLLLSIALGVLVAGSAQAAGPNSGANSVLIQPDGKILAAGWGETASWGAAGVAGLVRYVPGGSLDRTFGSGGKVAMPSGSSGAVALQPDGKIVTAGAEGGEFMLARYGPDGSLDRTFGAAGKVKTAFGSLIAQAGAVAIQADGKIVAAGPVWQGSLNGQQAGFALARYNPDGTLDTTFGTDGRVTTAVAGGGGAAALAIQPDGKLVVAGSVGSSLLAGNEVAIARYTSDGALDTSFGTGGIATSTFGLQGAEAGAVALQPDDKIVVAGTGVVNGNTPPEVLIARYDSDGSLDSSFGSNGVATTPFPAPGACDECGLYANAVALQADGKIVAAGQSCLGPCEFALERYNPDGSPDTGFGSDGMVTTSSGLSDSCSGSGGDFARAVALQADGKIVAAGYTNFGSCSPDYYRFALARYELDGSLDTAFGKAGFVNTSVAACFVPKLREESLSWAKGELKRSNCALGKVSSVFSGIVGKGQVVSTHPAPCALRQPLARVSLTISKGRRGKTSHSPAGALLFGSRTHLSCGGGGSGLSQLYTVKQNGNARQRLTRHHNAVEPDWSPDGRTIAFSRPTGGVLLMNANGSHVRVVVAGRGSAPTFSPDGKRIAFVLPATCRVCSSSGVIWTARTNGTAKRKIVRDGRSPDWSPDGEEIAFVAHDLNLYTVNAKGRDRKAVTHGGNTVWPVWSPNGEEIAFILAGETSWKLAVVNVSGGSTRILASDVNGDAKPAWSPDGTRIAYVRFTSTGEQLATITPTGGGLRAVTTMVGGSSGVAWRS